jgi:hypothetical protein
MYPSGYKEDKIYSLKPTDGSGDLTFTRASSATRVNAEGLIETPSVLGSELVTNGDFATDTGWSKETGWSISGGNLVGTSVTSGLAFQSGVVEAGKKYKATYDAVVTSGSIGLYFDGGTGYQGITTTSQTITVFFTAVTSSPLYFRSNTSDFTGSIDNVSVKEVITSNVPRIDYTGGGCGKLLLEPQRTNLVAYSEAFDNAYWTKSNSSVVSGFTSPDGTANAFKLVEDTSTAGHSVFRNSSTVTLDSYSFSCFVKSNGRNVKLDFFGGTNNAIFNLTTGVVVSTNGTGLTAKIETFSNGWYRCSVTQVQTSTTIYPNILCVDSSNNSTYTGDGTSGVYIYGAQLELGSYATSYIPTAGATVTRLADSASKTGISSVIGQTEGTLFVDVDFIDIGSVQVLLSVHDGASNKRLEIWANGSVVNGFIGGSVNIAIGNTTISEGRHKLAVAYNQSGDQAFYVDGVQVGTSSTAYTIAALTQLSYSTFNGSLAASGSVNNTMLFKTRLTNTELATLTTL